MRRRAGSPHSARPPPAEPGTGLEHASRQRRQVPRSGHLPGVRVDHSGVESGSMDLDAPGMSGIKSGARCCCGLVGPGSEALFSRSHRPVETLKAPGVRCPAPFVRTGGQTAVLTPLLTRRCATGRRQGTDEIRLTCRGTPGHTRSCRTSKTCISLLITQRSQLPASCPTRPR